MSQFVKREAIEATVTAMEKELEELQASTKREGDGLAILLMKSYTRELRGILLSAVDIAPQMSEKDFHRQQIDKFKAGKNYGPRIEPAPLIDNADGMKMLFGGKNNGTCIMIDPTAEPGYCVTIDGERYIMDERKEMHFYKQPEIANG